MSRVELLAGIRGRARRGDAGTFGEGTVVDALARMPISDGAREAIRARLEVSTAYPADDQEAASSRRAAPSVGGFATHSVAGGNQRIALGFARRLGERVHLRAPVERIAWGADGVRVTAGGARVEAPR